MLRTPRRRVLRVTPLRTHDPVNSRCAEERAGIRRPGGSDPAERRQIGPGHVPKYTVNRGLSIVQARRVLKAAKGERLYALYVLALCLGLRRGELLGLRWEDIDLDSGTLEVVQTLQRVGGALRFVRPKTRGLRTHRPAGYDAPNTISQADDSQSGAL